MQTFENRAHVVTGEPDGDEWLALLMLGAEAEITLFLKTDSRDAAQRARTRLFAVARPLRATIVRLATAIYRDEMLGGLVLSIRVTPVPTDSHLGRERSIRIQEARHRSVRARAQANAAGAATDRRVGAAARLADVTPVPDGRMRCTECGSIVVARSNGLPKRHSFGMQGISTALGPCRAVVGPDLTAAAARRLELEMAGVAARARKRPCQTCRREITPREDGTMPVHMDRRTMHACAGDA